MTAAQSRTNSRIRQRAVELRHRHCPVEFKQTGPHWGMYCQTHGTWISWVAKKDLERLR